jgi:mannose-6-phosphate isomerase-like protein (cupin superfamily)
MEQDAKVKVGYGTRIVVTHENSQTGGAIIEIEPGKQTDALFHRVSGKIVFVLRGVLKATMIKEGQVRSINVDPGESFYVKPGLIHQFSSENNEKVQLVEFASKGLYDDVYCVFKGSMAPEQKPLEPGELVRMSTEDVAREKAKEESIEEPAKEPEVAEKKPSRRRKRTGKKTSKQ